MTGTPSTTLRPLFPRLKRSDEQIKKRFAELRTAADVADLLEIDTRQFTYVLWRSPERSRYTLREVRKRNGGTRPIQAPRKSHRILQNKMKHALDLVAKIRPAAHGFSPGKSVVTNAAMHTNRRYVLNVDLENFFPSIHFGRVRGMLMSPPYCIGQEAATCIAQLCCHEGALPQGAPTSPVLSNMICAKLDAELLRAARQFRCRYSRYVDDLTFSTGSAKFPTELAIATEPAPGAIAGHALSTIIDNNGFTINAAKTRLQEACVRQEVTGLTVNRRPNVTKRYLSQLRAMISAWENHGYESAEREFLERYDSKHRPTATSERIFEHVVKGKLAYLKQVRGDDNNTYYRLRCRVNALLNDGEGVEPEQEDYKHDVFICHASEDKDRIVRPLAKALTDAQVRVWVDEDQLEWGDSLTKKINEGLRDSEYVMVVLSAAFTGKNWPEAEFFSQVSMEIGSGKRRVLPVLAGSDEQISQIRQRYPLIYDKMFVRWSPGDVGPLVTKLKRLLARS